MDIALPHSMDKHPLLRFKIRLAVMKLKLLSLGLAVCLSAPAFADQATYNEVTVTYDKHLDDMRDEIKRLATNIKLADDASNECLASLKTTQKATPICGAIKGYLGAYEYEYKSIKSYNRVRKIPRYEANLQNLLQRQLAGASKIEGKKLYLDHEMSRQARQERLSAFGQSIQTTVELYKEISDDRMDEIDDLRN